MPPPFRDHRRRTVARDARPQIRCDRPLLRSPSPRQGAGGCFIIDDFGRQLVSPRNLLNRWIVPLENRVDYLNLHTGKSFVIPFEELVIFSTNLEPEDLMDPAFLRRLPYKIEIGAPTLDIYKRIFQKECVKQASSFPAPPST